MSIPTRKKKVTLLDSCGNVRAEIVDFYSYANLGEPINTPGGAYGMVIKIELVMDAPPTHDCGVPVPV